LRTGARLLACVAVATVAAGAAATTGGCEAIVGNDVPGFTCSMTPYVDPGTGTCPAGDYCQGSGCTACQDRDICDGYDNDCNGKIDDGPFSDHDGDGYTLCGKLDPQTGAPVNVDCNDDDPTIHPDAKEICNGKDDNCDGIVDNPDLVCPPNQTCVPKTGQCIANTQVCTPQNCPAPMVCDTTTNQCVLPSSQDAGSTGCTSDEQCTTGICATTTELGPGQQSVCTQPCCTSADCAAGFVCYGAGTGGNYCLAATSLGRPAQPGTSGAGASCTRPADCRSGVCSGGKCEDTCCSDANCANGTSCAVTSFSGATTFACVPPPGTTTAYHSCSSNSDCASGYCQTYDTGLGTASYCVPSCCSSKTCGSIIGNPMLCYDDYLPPATSGPVVPVCDYPAPSSIGSGNVGDGCTRNSSCSTNRCLTFGSSKMCSDVCCVDSDCGKAGWVCRPTVDGPGTFLRCVPLQ
jgi:hypothetical protein